MADYILPLQRLVEQFRSLPGIGGKTAVRLAFSIVEDSEERAMAFADAILAAKREICSCEICGNLSTSSVCPICADEERDRSIICVVEDVRDVMAFERLRDFHGLYHVLGGLLSPMKGIGVEQIRVRELLERLKNDEVKEILIATGATVEGETTATYIARLLEPFGISVTRLAYGLPVGGDLEYADEITLHRALEGRQTFSGE